MEKLEKSVKNARNLLKFQETLCAAGVFLQEERASNLIKKQGISLELA